MTGCEIRKTLALAILLLATTEVSAASFTAFVEKVTDGDTILIYSDSSKLKVRLINIDAPESDQYWGKESREALAQLILRKTVRIEVINVDRFSRLLAQVWLGDENINKRLVVEGHAWVYDRNRNSPLLSAQILARENEVGLWHKPPFIPPWQWRKGVRDGKQKLNNFACGTKRYCTEMTSCAEAEFYLKRCGLKGLDGDSDGIPCESICR